MKPRRNTKKRPVPSHGAGKIQAEDFLVFKCGEQKRYELMTKRAMKRGLDHYGFFLEGIAGYS
jgi:hypothetical protein